MKRRDHSTSAKLASYLFHDDSRHATVMLGARFASETHYTPEPNGWPVVLPLADVTIRRSSGMAAQWRVLCSFDEDLRECMAKVACEGQNTQVLRLADDFTIISDVELAKDMLPEAVFGCLLGAATGAREGLAMTLARQQRGDEVSGRHLVPRSDWRAPKFSYTLRTATGSPFAEQWGFAVQEAVRQDGGFRLWVEQQRTGREVYLRLRSDGSIEGLTELEQLPAAVHGAGLGMLLAFAAVNAHLCQPRGNEQKVTQAVNKLVHAPVDTEACEASHLLRKKVQ